MGNRAVITNSERKFGVYLHWNGGVESVLAFCHAAKQLGYRDLVNDSTYGFARLTGLICTFNDIKFATGVGIGPLDDLDTDNGDNGTFVIDGNWDVVDRYGSGSDLNWNLVHLTDAERKKYEAVKQRCLDLANGEVTA